VIWRWTVPLGLGVGLGLLLYACASLEAAPLRVPSSTTVVLSPLATTPDTVPTTTTPAAPPTKTTPERGWLTIHGTGDVNLDPDYIPALADRGYDWAWNGLDGLFLDDDLTIVNLECSPSPLGVAEPKAFTFRCPFGLGEMASAGVEVANLGNNHSQDFGKEAMLDGRQRLLRAGLTPVGAGQDATEAALFAAFRSNGWSVAVVGFGGIVPHAGWLATADQAGMADGDTIESMTAAVAAADEWADLVVVTIHWGVELERTPRPDDIERAEALIAAGADVIFGHHSHRLQPLETVDGVPVFWSLGNFVWPNFSAAGSVTGVGRVVVTPTGDIDACLLPAFIEGPGHPVLTAGRACEVEG